MAFAIVLAWSSLAAAQPAEPRSVRVGVYQNKPKVFMDERGNASGVFSELLIEIARAERWELTFVPCEWTECLVQLEDGRIDLMQDVAHTRERETQYDFHRTPAFESWSQFYATPGTSIRALPDLAGKRVAVLQNSLQHKAFAEMMAGFGYDVAIVPTQSFEAAFEAVQAGDADVVIANHFFGDYFHRQYGLVRTSIVFQPAELHYATQKGRNPDLLVAIDRHLSEWRREPNSVYYATLSRWMDRPPVRLVPRRIFWIVGIALGLLVLAGALVLLLRRQVRAKTRHLLRANEELRRAEATLRSSEALLNSAQRLGRMGGWEWDVVRRMATWTEETHRIHAPASEAHASSAPELMEKLIACFEPDARASIQTAFERCCAEGESFELEAPFRTASGQRLWVRTNAEAVRNGDGRVVKVVGNIMDVTGTRAAEEARRHLEDQLRQSQKMEAIGKLAGGIAHDFNNLLTVIMSYTDLSLHETHEGDAARLHLTEVASAAQRAAALTRQLLAVSRTQVLELEPVDLNQVTAGFETMLRRVVGEDIDLRLVLAPDLGVTMADPGELERVIMNLVVNARDAMPAGGQLSIETANAEFDGAYASKHVEATPGPFVLLSVTDTGSGMDEATQARIFEPFFTTKADGAGTGLGLATAYGIVKQSGGHIQVESELGRGTTFRICLPRTAAARIETAI